MWGWTSNIQHPDALKSAAVFGLCTRKTIAQEIAQRPTVCVGLHNTN